MEPGTRGLLPWRERSVLPEKHCGQLDTETPVLFSPLPFPSWVQRGPSATANIPICQMGLLNHQHLPHRASALSPMEIRVMAKILPALVGTRAQEPQGRNRHLFGNICGRNQPRKGLLSGKEKQILVPYSQVPFKPQHISKK